jgi:cytochrome b561
MSWTNTKETYGWAVIVLHWIAAIGVIAMFTTGILAWIAEDAGDRAARGQWMGLHISTGATLFLFFAARIALHYGQVQPVKPPQAPWLNTLAAATQHLLLLAILIQIISGPLAVWSGGRAINVFDIVSLPSPFASRAEDVHEVAEGAHLVGRLTILFLLPLHVLGALKHLMLDRDGSFSRILWRGTLKAGPAAQQRS